MRAIVTFSSLISSAVLLAACSSTPVVEQKSAAAAAPAAPISSAPVADSRTVMPVILDPLNDPNSILAKRSVYFDFDSYVVKNDFNAALTAHAKYLGSSKAKTIVIQGNTDDRGGREYNLALGQKRSEAVRRALTLLGTPAAQMEAVSFGKEKPKANGETEAAWAENRRADIAYSAK